MADRVPIQEAQTKQPVSEPVEHAGVWEGTLGHMDYPDFHRMSEFYDIGFDDRKDQNLAEKVSFLTEWAKEITGSDDRLQHQTAIKNIIDNLGYSMKGKELVTKLYKWTRLDQDRRKIEKEMNLIGNKNGVQANT